MPTPLHFIVLIVAGWLNRELQLAVDYLRVENEVLREQLLKEPADYILSCQQVFQQRADQGFQVESVIILGHLLEDYKRLIERHEINLLVLNTKDEDQLAMHGLAYPLAIELREMPLLLL